MNQNQISLHLFEEITIRTIQQGSEILFRGKDVCKALELTNHNQALSGLTEVERKGVSTSDPLGGTQETTFVTEPGLYRLIFRSRKEAAKRFQDWVYQEVLPTIRTTGSYSPGHTAALSFIDALLERGADIKDAIRLATKTTPALNKKDILHSTLENTAPHLPGQPWASELDTYIIPELESEKTYTLEDILSLLPNKHPLTKGSSHSIRSTLGKALAAHPSLITQGKRKRNWKLANPSKKVVPIR